MKLGLEGKIVIVTGGTKGIGLACARAFMDEGARIGIISRSKPISTELVACSERWRATRPT